MLTHSELISFAWYNILPSLAWNDAYLETFESNMCQTIEKPDIIAIGDNLENCIVVECKASRADFLKDRKKPCRVYPDKGMGKYRAYVVNEGVVNHAGELPDGWMCFIVVDEDTFVELAGPMVDTSAEDPRDWWRKFEFKERNWKAEYETWKFLDYWQNKRGYTPKSPSWIGPKNAMDLKKLTMDEYKRLVYEREHGRSYKRLFLKQEDE